MNKFLNKCKIPKIPPLLVHDSYITNCKDKASIFNNFFTSQCSPFVNDSTLPDIRFHTTSRLSTVEINLTSIKAVITRVNNRKVHGPALISANIVKLCGGTLCLPLKMIFENILETDIFLGQWKEANVTPVHKKGDKQIISNYRSISLLPILAKVFEGLQSYY